MSNKRKQNVLVLRESLLKLRMKLIGLTKELGPVDFWPEEGRSKAKTELGKFAKLYEDL
jgi:hypothetical protein